MPIMRAQVVLQGKSNKPEDVFVNTFHFNTQGTSAGDADSIVAQLTELYNAPTGASGTGPLSEFLSNTISRAVDASRMKLYVIAPGPGGGGGESPNPPVRDHRWTLAQPNSSLGVMELPAEIAVVVSLYAGVNRPRHRGRCYFGPLIAMQEDLAPHDQAVVQSALRASLVASFARLIGKPANTQNLAIYSKVDGVARIVTNGWVDNAWDVQRRRGQDATVRTVFP